MELAFYKKYDLPFIKQYNLTDQQLLFTKAPLEAIQLAEKDDQRYPVLCLNEAKQLVSFFVLHINDGVKVFSDNPNAVLLRSFSTDQRQLKKGYAKQALLALPSFIKKNLPHINEIVLAVDETNKVAQALYEKTGFIATNKSLPGRIGKLMVMSFVLNRM